MDDTRLQVIDQRIRQAAQQAAAPDGLSPILIERFLRTREETWEGEGSGRFSLAQFKEDEAYTRASSFLITRDTATRFRRAVPGTIPAPLRANYVDKPRLPELCLPFSLTLGLAGRAV